MSVGLILAACAMGGLRAEESPRWYLGGGLGANYGERATLDGLGFKVDYDLGLPRVRGVVGYRLGERWWLELEAGQRKTKAEFGYTPGGGPVVDPGANDRYTSGALMLNVLREFPAGPWLVPYAGAGIGHAWLTYQLSQTGRGGAEDELLIDDDATALALEAVLGVRIPLTRNLDLGLEYEYWRTPDVDLKTVAGDDVGLDQTVHSGWLNLNYYPGARRQTGFSARRASGPSPRGWYLLGNVGVGWTRDAETGPVTFDAYAPGGVLSVALGRTLGTQWRLEAEYAYRQADAQLLDFGRLPGERRTVGDQRSSSLALNLHYHLLPDAAVQPILGVGAGIASAAYDMRFADDGTTFLDDKAEDVFFQGTAGLSVELSRALSFHAAWRIWIMAQHDVTLANGDRLDMEQWVQSVEFGLRYQLGN